MSESKKPVAQETADMFAPFTSDWSDRLTVKQYDTEYTKDNQKVDACVEPSANPIVIAHDTHAVSSDTRKQFRERVLAEPLDKVRAGLFSLDKAVTAMCWKTMNRAYQHRAPWMVTECLSTLKPILEKSMFSKVRQYFTIAGFELSESGVIMCLSIRDATQHRVAVELLRKKSIRFIRLVKQSVKKEEDFTGVNPAERVVAALKRVHDSAKKDNASTKTPEGQAVYSRQMALATAASDILSLLSTSKDDPNRIVEEFKAWFASREAKEIEAK